MDKRLKMHFAEAVLDAFDFLEKEFGFSRTIASIQKVRFESERVFVELNHGDYDFEVSIAFGRLHMPEPERFDFSLFLRLVNPFLEKTLGERIADKPDSVRETIRKVATAFRSEGIAIVTGNDAVFDRMKTVTWWQFMPDALQD